MRPRTRRVFSARTNPQTVFHADPYLVALLLLAAGVLGSVLPLVPGGLCSTVGVCYYWWVTGEPGPLALALLVTLALLAVAVDWLGGAVSARVGGASLGTTAAALLAGIALAFVLGPLGVVAGVFGVVLALEYRRHGDLDRGARTAGSATVGILVSTVAQVVLTVTVLGVFLLAA